MSTLTEYRLAEPTRDFNPIKDHAAAQQKRKNVLVYRNDLIERSETFVVAQAAAMRVFRPVFCGLVRRQGGILPESAPAAVLAGSVGIGSFLRKRAFMYAGWGAAWQQRCRQFQPVLLHAHFALDAAFALPLCSRLCIPLVVSLHGYDITHTDEAMRETAGGRLFLRRRQELFLQTDLFLCISEFVREMALARGFPENKLWVHSTGIDLDLFRPETGPLRQEFVLFVGRLVEKKGCAHLIRAMQEVQRRHPLAHLIVIGDGPLLAELRALAQATLPGKHAFLGTLAADVVRDWMRRSMVFSVPSVTAADGNAEGLGMVFCEAQAMGLPVVSSRSGGIAEVVDDGETGYLVPEREEADLANKICRLLEDRALWTKMSRLGRQKVADQFNLKVQTAKLEAKYEEILGRML